MPRKIPDDIGEWLATLRREKPEPLTKEEARWLNDWLHGQGRNVARHLLQLEAGRQAQADGLNLFDPVSAAEASRLQGEKRMVIAMIEMLWELADDDLVDEE